MKLLRLAMLCSAIAGFAGAVQAQTSPPQPEQNSGYQGCSSRNKPAATS